MKTEIRKKEKKEMLLFYLRLWTKTEGGLLKAVSKLRETDHLEALLNTAWFVLLVGVAYGQLGWYRNAVVAFVYSCCFSESWESTLDRAVGYRTNSSTLNALSMLYWVLLLNCAVLGVYAVMGEGEWDTQLAREVVFTAAEGVFSVLSSTRLLRVLELPLGADRRPTYNLFLLLGQTAVMEMIPLHTLLFLHHPARFHDELSIDVTLGVIALLTSLAVTPWMRSVAAMQPLPDSLHSNCARNWEYLAWRLREPLHWALQHTWLLGEVLITCMAFHWLFSWTASRILLHVGLTVVALIEAYASPPAARYLTAIAVGIWVLPQEPALAAVLSCLLLSEALNHLDDAEEFHRRITRHVIITGLAIGFGAMSCVFLGAPLNTMCNWIPMSALVASRAILEVTEG